MSLFLSILVVFQIVFSSALNICNTPPPTNDPIDERIRMVDISQLTGRSFLLSNITKWPAICLENDVVYRYEIEEPQEDDEVMEAARQKIGEISPNVVQKAKDKLIFLLKKIPDIRRPKLKFIAPLDNINWLIRYLRRTNFSEKAAVERMDYYYKYKSISNPSLFKNLIPSEQISSFTEDVLSILPKRDYSGRRIVIFKAKNWDPDWLDMSGLLKAGIILSETGAYEPVTQIAGVQFIFDVNGLNKRHTYKADDVTAKKILNYILRAAPLKIENVHIVNRDISPTSFKRLYLAFQPFLTKDIKAKIRIHDNMESLHRFVPPSILPNIYGGTFPMPSLTHHEYYTLLKAFDEEFERVKYYGYQKYESVTNSDLRK